MERKKASDYPQELLDLFHEYQHGDITRRDFLERAKKFAVGGVTALALYESLKPNYAWAQQVQKDDARIKTSYETVPSPQGNGSIKGYFAKPANASGKLPGVLVIHENRGLNPYIEDVARRLALLWGAHSLLAEDVHSYEEMVDHATQRAVSEGFAHQADSIVVVAGIPFGKAGTTNNLRVVHVGAE